MRREDMKRLTEQTIQRDKSRILESSRDGFVPFYGGEFDQHTNEYVDTIEELHRQYVKNPYIKNAVDTYANYVLGKGIEYTVCDKITDEAQSDAIRDVVDSFFSGRDNELHIKQYSYVMQFFLYGEIAFIVNASDVDDHVEISPVNPMHINRGSIKFKNGNAEKVESIRINVNGIDRDYKVISYNRKSGRYEGDIFFFRLNHMIGRSHGLSIISQIFEWAKTAEEYLFKIMENASQQGNFVFDLTCATANESELEEKRRVLEKHKFRPGGVYIHNESETLTPVSPSSNGADIMATMRSFLFPVYAGTGIPEHLWGIGGDVNYATAKSMNPNMRRTVDVLQAQVKRMFHIMFSYTIQNAVENSVITIPSDLYVDDVLNVELVPTDDEVIFELSGAFLQTIQALTVGIQSGLVSQETGVRISTMLMNKLGIEVDNEDEENNIDTEQGASMPDEYKEALRKLNEAISK